MSLAWPQVDAGRAPERQPGQRGAWAGWLVVGCYLVAAFAVTIRLWADPATRFQAAGSFTDRADVDQFAWFLRQDAMAVAHGRLPALVDTAMNAPHGISMLWNTSLLLPGIVLSPVTLLAGPQTALTVLLVLGFAGSAASLFLVLRRWGASLTAAGLGGAVYGFSPALLDAGLGHYNLQFAVLPPVIIDALMRLVTGRGRPVVTGAWLGGLIAAQLLTGEELLVDTALAGIVLVVVAAAGHPRAVPARVKAAAYGLATALAVTLVICGYALWMQFAGPLHQHGSPWNMADFNARPAAMVTPPGSLLFHTAASAAAAVADSPATLVEYLGYLGVPLLVVLVAAAVRYWHDPRIRALALTWAVLEVCTFGSQHSYLPWHYAQHVPLLGQIVTGRLAIPADGAAAAVLAFSLDRARMAAPHPAHWRAWLATGAAALAIAPLLPLPYQAVSARPVPAGWQAALTRLHLPSGAPVLAVPVPYQSNTDALRWQADTGDPQSLTGGYFIGPSQSGQAQEYGTFAVGAARTLDAIWAGDRSITPDLTRLRTTIQTWRPAAVIAVAATGSPIATLLTSLLGPPTFRAGDILTWRR